jgi:hypothetical protein
MSKNKVEMKFIANSIDTLFSASDHPGYWELTVTNKLVGKQKAKIPADIAMLVAVALGTARQSGKKEGYAEAKKKYEAIIELSSGKYYSYNVPSPSETFDEDGWIAPWKKWTTE